MKSVVLFLALLGLAACETGAPAANRPQQHDTAKPGVKVSGSARVGVSHTF
ncbi:hypothetical protein [Leisingera caerulea]|uniref:hypothetical protein n=1 Tax=Leisingera caerulea TaxID=506591 RepID=UPI0021A56B5A|nr:hypothetical protein [Leisingera caerulea]UWQ84233.1 hypothetical protein K3726_03250 [Leisingera caerulea]